MPLQQQEAVPPHRGILARQEVGSFKLSDTVRGPPSQADGARLSAKEALPFFVVNPLAHFREPLSQQKAI